MIEMNSCKLKYVNYQLHTYIGIKEVLICDTGQHVYKLCIVGAIFLSVYCMCMMTLALN